ncbi:hypothetical protein [Actinomadura yumaensis]|uniref:Uncharacterized protein n=1 Tax=Actinomadura yumaensis TaxID=111807 RepID=A0ABW2CUR8_9ACTN
METRPLLGELRVRSRVLAGAAGTVAALAAGWPLANAALGAGPGREPLPAGRILTLGGVAATASLTVGAGWTLDRSSSGRTRGYALARGGLDLRVDYVTPPGGPTAAELWEGLGRVLRVGDPGARLGAARPAGTAHGASGLTGTLVRKGRRGQATVLPAPDGSVAVEALAVGGDAAARAAARRVVASIVFGT